MALLSVPIKAQNHARPTFRHTATLTHDPSPSVTVGTESCPYVSPSVVISSRTADSDLPPSAESPFLLLPQEIRLQICTYIFLPLTVHCAFNPAFEEAGADRIGSDGPPTPMLAFRITPPFMFNADEGNPLHAPTTTSYDWDEADPDAPLQVHLLNNVNFQVPQDRRWCPAWRRTYEVVHHRHLANDRFRGIGVTCKQIYSETESLRYDGLDWSMCDPCVMLQLAYLYTTMALTATLASTGRSSDLKASQRLPPHQALSQIHRVALSYNFYESDTHCVAAVRPRKVFLSHLDPILKGIQESSIPSNDRLPFTSPSSMISHMTEKHVWTAFWTLLTSTAPQGMSIELKSLRLWVTYHSSASAGPPTLEAGWVAPMLSVRIHDSKSTGPGVAECGIKWKKYVAGMRNREAASRQRVLERALEEKWCQASEAP